MNIRTRENILGTVFKISKKNGAVMVHSDCLLDRMWNHDAETSEQEEELRLGLTEMERSALNMGSIIP